MEIWSAIECRERHSDQFEFDDHDVSFFRSWKMLIRFFVDSLGSDLARGESRSVELRHFEGIVGVRPEASSEHGLQMLRMNTIFSCHHRSKFS